MTIFLVYYISIIIMSCVSHAEPPNVSYDEKVKIENDGEFYTVTVNFSVSQHTII